MRPKTAAALGVAIALAIGAASIAKWRSARAPRDASESTVAVRITQRDAVGLPTKKSVLRDPARVRALVDALGVDRHAVGACPPDYAEAPIGIVLSGTDVYARRNVYVFDADAGEASVVTVTSAGCRVGPPTDRTALMREIDGAKPLAQ